MPEHPQRHGADGMTQVFREDFAKLPRVDETSEGFLRGEAVVTRTGVFVYRQADGTERRELRHPDDILAPASLATLSMLPMTNGHPPSGIVNADTADKVTIGHTGERASADAAGLISLPLTITHRSGIEAVRAGRRELSLGYFVSIDEESGVYKGEPYTHRQRNPVYNHLAIVDTARAGPVARLNIDGAAAQIQSQETYMADDKLISVSLDGLSYQAAPEVAKALDKMRADLAAEKLRADGAIAERDAAQARTDAAIEDAKALKARIDGMPAEIATATKARGDLEKRAARVDARIETDGKTDREVMEAAIKAHRPALNLDGKSDDYVRAAFDLAVESAGDPGAIKRQAKAASARSAAAEKPSSLLTLIKSDQAAYFAGGK